MNVGFYHAGDNRDALHRAALMVRSVRGAMPTVPVIQFTDKTTPMVNGVDSVLRREPLPIALAVLEAYANTWPEDHWLLLDTDVLVQADVRDVFSEPFDIAVATREGTLKDCEVGTKFMARHPFNKGVVFSRSTAFWEAALKALRAMPEKLHGWMGDQQAMCAVIASEAFHVQVLSNAYNYPPKAQREDVRDKHILHFKGPRKAWLMEPAA